MAITAEIVIGTYEDRTDAETAVRSLVQCGIEREHISMIGRSSEIEEAITGHWELPKEETDVMRAEGERAGLMTGGVWGLLGGLSIFVIPGIGEIAILSALGGLVLGGALGVFVGWLAGLSTSGEIASRYRQVLTEGKFLVMVTGTPEKMESIVEKLAIAKATGIERLPKHLKMGGSSHKAKLI